MKRNQIVEKLINEGFSEKTLVKFSDKQLSDLSERIFGEAITTTADAMSKSASIQNLAKKQDVKLVGEEDIEEDNVPTKKQLKALDKNKNKKIDSEDFKLLRKEKKGGGDSKKKEKTEVKEWVNSLVNEKYHNFTRKGEIMELIQSKMTNSVSHGPNVKKGHNGIPEFMSYDAIKKSEMKEGDVKTKPKVTPTTKPKKDSPYRPKPGKETNPKALTTNEDEVKTKPKVTPKTPSTKPKKDNPYTPKKDKQTNPKA
jgi:hypothetical protein